MAGLYLASQSPRRTELLTQVGIDHIVVSSAYEEANKGYDDPIEMVKEHTNLCLSNSLVTDKLIQEKMAQYTKSTNRQM